MNEIVAMNRIVSATSGDYLVHRGLTCSREQDSRREQNSPRYSGDYLVHMNRIVACEQDSRL